MGKSQIADRKSQIFLGVDGGQSHTDAVIADADGNILGRGSGGASNHAEQPGGRERLRRAVLDSVGAALRDAEMRRRKDAANERTSRVETESGSRLVNENFAPASSGVAACFKSAHFGMTGGADFKEEIIGEIIAAENLKIGHDAPTALFGATGGKPGIVVIAGTGSIIYGENSAGASAQIGGLGFLFSDEGSGFWLAAQTIRLAIKEHDRLLPDQGLEKLVLDFFGVRKIRDLTTAFYNEKISRDEIAALARIAAEAAASGNRALAAQISYGADVLAQSVQAAAERLELKEDLRVAGVGGMFRAALLKKEFAASLGKKIPPAKIIEPRFDPAIGALLLAFRQAKIKINEQLLSNIENSQTK